MERHCHPFRQVVLAFLLTACCLTASSISAEEKLTRALSCFEIGYRFGKCATQAMLGQTCDPKDDVIVPERCRNKPETKRGIDAGVKSVLKQ
jgi:hypothetical protein